MPLTGHLFLKYIIPQRLPQGQGCGMLNVRAVLLKIIMILSNPTHHPFNVLFPLREKEKCFREAVIARQTAVCRGNPFPAGAQGCKSTDYLNPTHHPRRRGLRLLEAISYGYTSSFTPSLLLFAKKRRYALDFSRAHLREKEKCFREAVIARHPTGWRGNPFPNRAQGCKIN